MNTLDNRSSKARIGMASMLKVAARQDVSLNIQHPYESNPSGTGGVKKQMEKFHVLKQTRYAMSPGYYQFMTR